MITKTLLIKRKDLKKIILCLIIPIFFLNIGKTFAQKNFYVSIIPPKELKAHELKITYDNGKLQIQKQYFLTGKTITISDSFISKYAAIIIRFDSNSLHLPDLKIYFISDKPAIIDFTLIDTLKDTIIPKLKNAFDINNMGATKLKQFTSDEQNAVQEFYANQSSLHASTWDTENRILIRKLINKELKFIEENTNLYFSFWLFRNEIAPNIFMDPDSLMQFYIASFPDKVRKTKEGKEVTEILKTRDISLLENTIAPNFLTTDILGNNINSKSFNDEYILINFWASWCGPCIAELPAIKEIEKKYSTKLKIISISLDNDTTQFLNAIKKYKMDWINIYGDHNLAKLFGVTDGISMLYLIAPNRQIIYNRKFETDFVKLLRLKQILKEKLK